jgi:hypothetical protein
MSLSLPRAGGGIVDKRGIPREIANKVECDVMRFAVVESRWGLVKRGPHADNCGITRVGPCVHRSVRKRGCRI